MTPHDQWADMARQAPGGFAGVLYDNGQPVLMLTRPEEAAAAKAELAPLLRTQIPDFDLAGAEVRPARWDFAQLHDWEAYLLKQGIARSGSGVNRSGKDQIANRLSFGVADAAARARVADELDALGVPCDLVLVKITAPLRGLSAD
jgi:hypothetical protein